MKRFLTRSKSLALLALAAFAVGCATSSKPKSREEIALAADFKVITPTKPDQKAILEKLPSDKVSKITYRGKIYYVLPDKADHQAYVGGPRQYAAYQQLGGAKQTALDYNEADAVRQWNRNHPTDWSGWDGWDDWAAKSAREPIGNGAAANGWY